MTLLSLIISWVIVGSWGDLMLMLIWGWQVILLVMVPLYMLATFGCEGIRRVLQPTSRRALIVQSAITGVVEAFAFWLMAKATIGLKDAFDNFEFLLILVMGSVLGLMFSRLYARTYEVAFETEAIDPNS